MIRQLCTGLLLLAASGAALAAPAAKPAEGAAASTGSADTATGRTDIIGSQEAPSVFNVVPWKDKPSRLPKKEVTTSILRETLQPLDPEILLREIELQKRLGEQ